LNRFEERDFEDAPYDDERPERPPEISEEQFQQFAEVLHQLPEETGYDEPAWSSALTQQYLIVEFDVAYSDRHVQRLMRKIKVSYSRSFVYRENAEAAMYSSWSAESVV
jgi:transposase